MTAATLPRIDRTARALGIIERNELAPVAGMPGLFTVTDTLTGSGAPHVASAHKCDCFDWTRGNVCKHISAVRRAIATTLEAEPIADGVWDVVETYTGTLYRVQGSHCPCRDGGDCAHLQAVRTAARDLVAYARAWDAEVLHNRTHCPKCSAPLESEQVYVAGRYIWVELCRAGGELHYSRRG